MHTDKNRTQSPSHNLLLSTTTTTTLRRTTANIRTNLLIHLTHLRIAGQLLPRWKHLATRLFLAGIMLRDNLAHRLLEEERRLLELGVQLAINEDASVEVPLLIVAEDFVFSHDALVHVVDESEVFFCGVAVAVDLVGHFGGVGASGEEFLDHDPMRAGFVS